MSCGSYAEKVKKSERLEEDMTTRRSAGLCPDFRPRDLGTYTSFCFLVYIYIYVVPPCSRRAASFYASQLSTGSLDNE